VAISDRVHFIYPFTINSTTTHYTHTCTCI